MLDGLKFNLKHFTDQQNYLRVSDSTLPPPRRSPFTRHGHSEIDEKETAVDGLYRISERGQYVIAKAERLNIPYAYCTMLDMHQTIEQGKQQLVDWVTDDDTKQELAQ